MDVRYLQNPLRRLLFYKDKIVMTVFYIFPITIFLKKVLLQRFNLSAILFNNS